MKKLLVVVILCLPVMLHAQDRRSQSVVDSLTRRLALEKTDSLRVKMMNDVSYELNPVDVDQSILYGEQALALSEKIHWNAGRAASYATLASGYQTKTDYPKALDNYLKALSIFESLGYKERVGRTMSNIGTLYYSLDKYDKALEYYTRALNIATEANDSLTMSASMGNMGSIYRAKKAYDQSLNILNHAFKINEAIKYQRGMIINLQNMGMTYSEMKDYPRSLKYQFKSMALSEATDNKMTLQMNLESIGMTYLQIFKDSTRKAAGDTLVAAAKQENLRRGLNYLNRAMGVAKETDNLNDISTIAGDLSEAYELNGDYKEALHFNKEAVQYRDSIFSMDKSLNISARETQREAELKNKQIQINRQAIVQKRNERIIFGAGLALLLVVIVAVFKNYKTMKQRNDLQEELLSQKEMLMKEIHHRVKNNLQVVSSLLDLQLRDVTDSPAVDAIAESAGRLKAMSLIHEQLYQDDHITTIECVRFTHDLHQQLSAVFNKPGQTITYKNEGVDIVLDVDTAVPLGLIINELMTNSYKYAFRHPVGSINLKIEKAGMHYRLLYSDSGDGLPVGMKIKTLKSLGMKIIRSLSKQLGGSFNYDADTRNFIVTFNDRAGRKLVD